MLRLLIVSFFLTGCATTDSYNNEQIRTQCAIGYHEEYTKNITLSSKDKSKIGKSQDQFSCVPDR